MPYVKTINEDGVVSDIMAVALDSELDATLLHKSELVNGFTQTTPGVNALDAAAGKSLNDSLASKANASVPTLYFKIGTNDDDPSTTNPHVELRSAGNASSGRSVSFAYYNSSGNITQNVVIEKDGSFLPNHALKTDLSAMVIYRDLTITPSTAINVPANGVVYYSGYTNPSVSGYTCVSVSVLSQQGSAGGYCVFAPRASTSGMTICNNHSAAASITEIKLRYVFLKN